MQIKQLFCSIDFFVLTGKMDKADICVFKGKFYETMIPFLGESTVILGRGLEGQNNLQ